MSLLYPSTGALCCEPVPHAHYRDADEQHNAGPLSARRSCDAVMEEGDDVGDDGDDDGLAAGGDGTSEWQLA